MPVIRFFRDHAAALAFVFLASVLLFMAQYAASYRFRSDFLEVVAALFFFGSFPWSWLLVWALEPLLAMLPVSLGDPVINIVFAVGFGINVTLAFGFIWWWVSPRPGARAQGG